MKAKQTTSIHQSKRGINLVEGYYLIRNPTTKIIAIISIVNGVVSIHEVKSQISIQQLAYMESMNQVEVFEALRMSESEKQKSKNQQRNDD